MVAPLAASLGDEVAFVIEVAGWQGPAWKQDAVRVAAERFGVAALTAPGLIRGLERYAGDARPQPETPRALPWPPRSAPRCTRPGSGTAMT